MFEFSKNTNFLAIDLGSYEIRVSIGDKIIIEPPLIAINKKENKILAIGNDAKKLLGRLNDVFIIQVVKDGRIYDLEAFKVFFNILFKKIYKNFYFYNPIVAISVGAEIPKYVHRYLQTIFLGFGASRVYVVPQLLSSAIGSGVPIAESKGSLIFILGGDLVEIGVISLSTIIKAKTYYIGGSKIDEWIQNRYKIEEEFSITIEQAENLKKNIGTLTNTNKTFVISGKDTKGKIMEIRTDNRIVNNVLINFFEEYESLLKSFISHIPLHLLSDILNRGVIFTGGLSQVPGVEDFFINSIGIPAFSSDDPVLSSIKGLNIILKNIELFKDYI